MTNQPDPRYTGHYLDRDITSELDVKLDVINGRDAIYMTSRVETHSAMVKLEVGVTLNRPAVIRLRDQLNTMIEFNDWGKAE